WLKSQFGAKEEKANDFGMTMAILGGDSLINLGSEAISQSELDLDVALQCLRWYQMGFSDLVEGVLLEMMMIRDPEVPIETYLEMVRLKTATLFQKALLFGAKMAGASDSQLDGFSEFGVKVGQAFQVQDDILGSFGDEAETGKSSSGDIREGKKTMLLIQALKLSNADQRKVLDDLLGKDDMTEEEVEKVRQVFKKSGALDATKELMERLLREGQAALKNANPPLKPRFLEFLLELSEFLTSRAF
ncbi:MAG: polyprenyl synthetase family protein, partial [Candidatus Hodarchaeota archaeon]